MHENLTENREAIEALFDGKVPNITEEFDKSKGPTQEEIERMLLQIRYLLESKSSFAMIYSFSHGDDAKCTSLYSRNFLSKLAEVITEVEPLMDQIKLHSIRKMLAG